MTDTFDSYASLLQSLVKGSITCSPANWNKGRLTITCDGAYLNYALKNSHIEEKAQISDNYG